MLVKVEELSIKYKIRKFNRNDFTLVNIITIDFVRDF